VCTADLSAKFSRAPSQRLRLLMDVSSRRDQLAMQGPLRWEWEQDKIPDELRQWVHSFTVSGETSAMALARITETLRGWRYDLNAPIDAAQPVTSFLQNKSGHCELYATTLALAARELGFASRVINGYLGGDWNEIGQFLQIRSLHAHSWTEVWLDGAWKRMDATPSVRDGLLNLQFPGFDQFWESIKLGWYRYVLEFQNSDRVNFLKSIWLTLSQYGTWFLATVLAIGLIFYLWRSAGLLRFNLRSRPKQSQLWTELDRWLARRDVIRQPYQPLRDTARPDGVRAELWQNFVVQWEEACYGSTKMWNRDQLKRHLRALLKSC